MTQPTVLEILNKTTSFLQEKGVENARADSQWLLGHALGLKRLALYLNFERPLTEPELTECRRLVLRRSKREPLQHILGETPFRELNLRVDRRALIPRPETELIVDTVRRLLEGREHPAVVEVGIGTGAICLSLMREIPAARIFGVELSRESISLAMENAAKNDLSLAGKIIRGDSLSAMRRQTPIDMVVSNPPYVGQGEFAGLAEEVRLFDPELALVGGPEGWEFPLRLITEAHAFLGAGGYLVMEIGQGQAERLLAQAAGMDWASMETVKDYQEVERFLVFRKKE